eukprot:357225-Chlamydomonas_euryale.AAC.2
MRCGRTPQPKVLLLAHRAGGPSERPHYSLCHWAPLEGVPAPPERVPAPALVHPHDVVAHGTLDPLDRQTPGELKAFGVMVKPVTVQSADGCADAACAVAALPTSSSTRGGRGCASYAVAALTNWQ